MWQNTLLLQIWASQDVTILSKKGLAYDVKDACATYAGLVQDVTYRECKSQNDAYGCVFVAFQVLIWNKTRPYINWKAAVSEFPIPFLLIGLMMHLCWGTPLSLTGWQLAHALTPHWYGWWTVEHDLLSGFSVCHSPEKEIDSSFFFSFFSEWAFKSGQWSILW